MKNIALLGASGSIGKQTIDILNNNRDKYQLVTFSVGKNIDYAIELINLFPSVTTVCVQNSVDQIKLQKQFSNLKIVSQESGLIEIATVTEIDIVINALVGFIGLIPTIKAIESKKDMGLANKETLVCAGHIIMPLALEKGINLYPIDSEHSAIFQVMQGIDKDNLDKIILTASGGSFREKTREQLKGVTVSDALNHPNWSMGQKITIDSATMFNKGLEVIEAHHLFNIDYQKIDVLIHHESIIHSMIQLKDYSIFAQLGTPDMRLPIQFALSYPDHQPIVNSQELNLAKIAQLNFKEIDYQRYPAVKLAYMAGIAGGSMPTVLNSANEVAVELFLNQKITFLEIEQIVEKEMDNHQIIDAPTIKQIIEVDKMIRNNLNNKFNN